MHTHVAFSTENNKNIFGIYNNIYLKLIQMFNDSNISLKNCFSPQESFFKNISSKQNISKGKLKGVLRKTNMQNFIVLPFAETINSG